MSGPNFYLPGDWGKAIRLEGAEARHAQALRLQKGQTVFLLDGLGRKGQARITGMNRAGLDLELLGQKTFARPKALSVMALAFSKAVRRGFFMEKAAELGAHAIWFWQGEHSQGRLPADAAKSAHGQLVAGIKQCGNPWLPEVECLGGLGGLSGIDELVSRSASADHRILPWEMQSGVAMLTPQLAGRPGLTVYVIGPEGGFSRREFERLNGAGFVPVSLGTRILRCETAATLTLGLHWWASQQPGGPDHSEACPDWQPREDSNKSQP